ncbi:MAG TPA: hypothetical protein PLL78_13225 [Fimbriimonadaceae bacterium]|nr:hypothetical protein [Fimbriimonadaceae bacterium]HRJ97637.1 hypothetical protein [Fimbriimonadaceae bacterium]
MENFMKVLGKVGLVLLVWILIPTAFGLVGYYYVGPSVGKDGWLGNLAKSIASSTESAATPKASTAAKSKVEVPEPEPAPAPDTSTRSRSKFEEPEIEVTVTKANPRKTKRTSEDEPVRRKKATKLAPAPEKAVPAEGDPASAAPSRRPPTGGGSGGDDDGGSGGVTRGDGE